MTYKKILIKDQNKMGSQILALLFNLHNGEVDVDIIDDNESFFNILKSEHDYELLMYDPGMLYHDAIDIVKDIKSGHYSKESEKMDIYITSGHVCNGDKQRFIDAGAKLFIAKPFNFDNLLAYKYFSKDSTISNSSSLPVVMAT